MNDSEGRLAGSTNSGRLEGISVPDLLWKLCLPGRTGVLELRAGGTTKKVYILDGRIVFAASSDPNDRLGERLLRDGIVRLEQLEQAVARIAEGKRLGTLLVEAGHLTPENLVRGVLSQVRGIVLDLFLLEEGEYEFHEGPLPTEEVVTLNVRTGEILLHGIRRIRSFSRIRRSVGSPRARYRLAAQAESAAEGLGLSDGERALLDRLGREGADVETLCRDIFLSNFEIYQAIWAFKVLGLVEEAERLARPDAPGGLEGRLGRGGLGELIVRLARAEETGVLRVSRGTVERSLHLKDGRCVFATSNNIDDGLVAHLLRRGVISLHDREETARRLLSNKRVGTILLQMGVISESDLRSMVREQLSEIVYDTFRWPDGEWFFSPGELPTLEEITLDMSLEDLVFSGVRRVNSWSTVLAGTGGLDVRLMLTPDYLAVLDRMTGVRQGDWEILALLADPKKVVDVCRVAAGGDFATCQTLWALRLLGAVAEAPPEAAVDAALAVTRTAEEAAPEADPDPAPIAPVEVSSAEPFEVTGTTDMEAPVEVSESEASVPASDWTEPGDDALCGPAWTPVPGETALGVANADGAPGELVSEAWRLTSEFPAPAAGAAAETQAQASFEPEPRAPETETEAADEAAFDAPHFEIETPRAAAEPAAEEPPSASDEVEALFRVEDPSQASPPPAVLEIAMPMGDLPPRPMPPPDDGEERQLELAEPQPETEQWAAAPPPDDPNRTQVLSREEVERAIFGADPIAETAPAADGSAEQEPAPEAPPAIESQAAAEPPFDPPADLDGWIATFNSRHKVVFRAIRSEIGAGAVNFVRSCRNGIGDGFAAMLHEAEIRPDGSFDAASLRKGIVDHRVTDAWDGFERLLAREVEMLRVHVGQRRAEQIAEEMAKL